MRARRIPADPDAAEHRRVLAQALDGWHEPTERAQANRRRSHARPTKTARLEAERDAALARAAEAGALAAAERERAEIATAAAAGQILEAHQAADLERAARLAAEQRAEDAERAATLTAADLRAARARLDALAARRREPMAPVLALAGRRVDLAAIGAALSGRRVEVSIAEREIAVVLVAAGLADAATAARGLGVRRAVLEQAVARTRRRLRDRLAETVTREPDSADSLHPSMEQTIPNPSTGRVRAA